MNLFGAVCSEITKSSRQGQFTRSDAVHVFNFARTLAAHHLELAKNFHFHFVNPTALRVECSLFGHIATLPDACPLSRVAVMCHAYSVEDRYLVSVGRGV